MKSADEVLRMYASYKTKKDIGWLAVALAKFTYFGANVMSKSTVTGCGNTMALDAKKMLQVSMTIRDIFPLMSDDEFEEVWKTCKDAIGRACKHLRRKGSMP